MERDRVILDREREMSQPRAECQICGNEQAVLKDGTITNHGYKVKGWGFIIGNCPGAKAEPFPAHDVLEAHIQRAEAYVEEHREKAEKLERVRMPVDLRDRRTGQMEYRWFSAQEEIRPVLAEMRESTDAGVKRALRRVRGNFGDLDRATETAWEEARKETRSMHKMEVRHTESYLKFARPRLEEAKRLTGEAEDEPQDTEETDASTAPPEDAAGLVESKVRRATGTRVSVYNAAEAGLCTASGEWATVCEDHGSILNHRTRDLAERHAVRPDGWCEECTVG